MKISRKRSNKNSKGSIERNKRMKRGREGRRKEEVTSMKETPKEQTVERGSSAPPLAQ